MKALRLPARRLACWGCLLGFAPTLARAELGQGSYPWLQGLGLLVVGVLALGLLVQNRRLAQARARIEHEVNWRDQLIAELPVGVYELFDDPQGVPCFEFVSAHAQKLFGVSRSELEADFFAVFRHFHPDDVESVKALNAEARASGTAFKTTARLVLDGQTRWLQIQSRPRTVGDHRRWAGIVTDVTEQTLVARGLAEAEARFRLLFEQSPLSIMVHDVQTGAVIDANRAAWQSYGLNSLKALKERNLWAEPPYSEVEAVARIQGAAKGQAQTFEWVSIDVHGRRFRELVTLMPVVIDGQLRVFSSSIDISELHAARQRFQAIFEASPVAITVQDVPTGALLEANAQAWRNWGFESMEQMLGSTDQVWLDPPYDQAASLARMQQAVARGGERFEWPSRHIDGRVMWHEVSITPLDVDGRQCALSMAVDITIRREGERMLRESEERFRLLLEDIEGVAVQGYSPDGSVNYWNRASERLYGYSQAEALNSNLLDLIIPPAMREGVRNHLARVAEGGSIPNGELELLRKDGSPVTVHSSHTVLRSPGRVPELFCVDIDISDRKQHEQALQRIANYDALTGLPNRNLLSELMREQTARADRTGRAYALCYLDLDEFKPINDRHGHAIGDQVLIHIAGRLRRVVRGSDVVARLGGDEFVLLLEDMDDPAALQSRLELMLERLARPIRVDSLSLQVQASIGVTLYPQDRADPDTLLRHADQAMYQAKSEGRNRFSLFDAELEEGAQRRRRRLLEIDEGLKARQFQLYYHPKIDLRLGTVAGLEALVRWQHPVEGLLAPAAFLGDLAHSDLERAFGAYVIEEALGQIAIWRSEGREVSVSVNISGPHLLHPAFVDELQSALARHPDVPPRSLIIEIVESAAVVDLELAIEVLHKVQQLGSEVSLDDFGTGYSSLSHLRSLPVNEVKVDQSFVRDMLNDPNDHSIVRSVLGLAAAFNLRVVAEGVETAEHIRALKRLDCGLGQGYVFSRPLPAAEVERWLAAWPQRSANWPSGLDEPARGSGEPSS